MPMTRSLTCLCLLAFSLWLMGCDQDAGTPPENAPVPANPTANNVHSPENSENEDTQPKTAAAALAPEDVKLTRANWEELLSAVGKHEGKVVVLDIWALSCQPCLREFPNLVNLSQKYPEQVVCLSLNTDYYGGKTKPPEYYEESVRKMLSDLNASFDNYLCTIPSDELYEKIGLASIPAVYVFGPDGEVAERFDNDEQKFGDEFTYSDHIIPKIESLLNSAK